MWYLHACYRPHLPRLLSERPEYMAVYASIALWSSAAARLEVRAGRRPTELELQVQKAEWLDDVKQHLDPQGLNVNLTRQPRSRFEMLCSDGAGFATRTGGELGECGQQ
eukprot:152311-Prymnesium_polylepis.1